MEDGASSFPLLNLPNAPLKCVFWNMDMANQIGFSILSKQSKELVKSLNMKAYRISLTIGNIVTITGCSHSRQFSWSFYTEELRRTMAAGNRPPTMKMYSPELICTRIKENKRSEYYEWKNQGFQIKDWIEHFLSIFHHTQLDELFFNGVLFDLDSLQSTVNDVNMILMGTSYPSTYIQRVVQMFPSAKKLNFRFDDENNRGSVHNIFCQNIDVLTLRAAHDVVKGVNLNDLLIMNSRRIILSDSNLSKKDVNRFLKHWKNGSNPRMEYFEININPNIISNEGVLDGLDYQILPSEHVRVLKEPITGFDFLYNVSVRGGYDIQRKDGTTATIIFGKLLQFPCSDLKVFVWH